MEADRNSPARPLLARSRTGLALGALATACEARGGVRPRPGRVREQPLPSGPDQGWSDVFRGLLTPAGGGTEVSIALLRPLAATKALRLPPVRGAALRALVARGAERWFPFAAGDAVAVAPLPAGDGDETAPSALVSAGDAAVVEGLLAAAREAGVEVAAVVPGAHAVAAAAVRLTPELALGRQRVVVLFHHATEALLLEGGALRRVRSLPFASTGGEWADAVRRAAQVRALMEEGGDGDEAPPTSLAGAVDADLRDALGADEAELGPALVAGGLSAEALAAFGAALPAAHRHDLRPEAHRLPSRRAALRRTAALLAGAAAVGIVAMVGHLRAVEEAGERAARMRATLRPGVQAVLRTRAEIDSLRGRLAALERVEAARQRWVPFFDRFAAVLPRDAYVQSLRAEGEAVAIEGYARSASSLVLALGSQPGLHEVRFTSSVQRETTPAGERERFSLRFGVPDLLPAAPDSAAALLPSGAGSRRSREGAR